MQGAFVEVNVLLTVNVLEIMRYHVLREIDFAPVNKAIGVDFLD